MYDDAESIALYMLAAPDSARMINELERVLSKNATRATHHEEATKMQLKFHKDVQRLLEVLRDVNPFTDRHNLKRLDTRDVMEEEVITSYTSMDELGKGLSN